MKKLFNDEGVLKWGKGSPISIDDYDKKVLEIVLPDIIISESALEVLNEFKIVAEENGIEIWYCIAK